MYPARFSIPFNTSRVKSWQTYMMLSTQDLVLYYLYALHDHYAKNTPLLISGSSVAHDAPCGANGHECYNILVWCQHAHRHEDFWYRTKLPSRRTFIRAFNSLGVTRKDRWGQIRAKLPRQGHAHILQVRQNTPELLTDLCEQVRRYRENKQIVLKEKLRKLNNPVSEPKSQGVTSR